jgi:phage terminase large subunit-like protein
MSATIDTSFERWRADPISFIEEVLINPETGKPFVLLDAEREFLTHAFKIDHDGRLVYPEQCYSAPKKTGKTVLGAIHLLTTTLLFGGRYAESYCVANDFEQAQSRVFEAARRKIYESVTLAPQP